MDIIIKWIAKLIPVDPDPTGGFWFFRLPERCQWMQSAFKYHDYYYEIGFDHDMRLSDIDWRIFKALTILAEQPDDPMERCRRAKDICKYWRIMRIAGRFLYNRHRR